MEFMPKKLSPEESDKMIDRINLHFIEHGFGLFAAEHLHSEEFMGYIGFQNTRFKSHFTLATEIAFRLKPEYWGRGLASEGARKCLEWYFEQDHNDSLVSFTAMINKRSESVMQRIGMTKEGEFDHPVLDKGHPLRRHVLYRIKKSSVFGET